MVSTMWQVFLTPLKKHKIVTERELHSLFLNLPDLYEFSCQFSAELLRRQDERAVVKRIGDVLLKFVSGVWSTHVSEDQTKHLTFHSLFFSDGRVHYLRSLLEKLRGSDAGPS